MKSKEDKLNTLIKFIQEFSIQPGNEMMALKLKELYATPYTLESEKELNTIKKYLENIAQYLSIQPQNIIDYSDFPEEVKKYLVKDNIEMNRCQIGTIDHVANFPDFCNYAFKQIEGMLNYFFLKIFNAYENNVIEFYIKYFYDSSKNSIPPEKITYLTSAQKLLMFSKIISCSAETNDILYFLRTIRNTQSHTKITQSYTKNIQQNDKKFTSLLEENNHALIIEVLEDVKALIIRTDASIIVSFEKKQEASSNYKLNINTIGDIYPDLIKLLEKQ